MQDNPAFSTLSKSKNTDMISHFPVPKCLEIHSELSDWIIKSSVGKIQPFRNIVKLYNGSKATQTPASFQSFKILSGRPTAVSGIQRYNQTEAFLKKKSHSLRLVLMFCPRLDFQRPKPERSECMEKGRVCVSICSQFLSYSYFISPSLQFVRSSPRRRPYCRDNRRKRADKSPAYTTTPSDNSWECPRSSRWQDHTWPLSHQRADEKTSTDGRRAAGYLGQVWPTLQHTWTSGRKDRGWSTPVPPTCEAGCRSFQCWESFLSLWWDCSDQWGFWSLCEAHQTQWSAIWQRRWEPRTVPRWACSRRPQRWTPWLRQPAWQGDGSRERKETRSLLSASLWLLVTLPPPFTVVEAIVRFPLWCKLSLYCPGG